MDPLDPGRVRLDGLRCAVCDGSVPADAVQLLAWRDDVAFVQLSCDACSSSTLAFLVDGASPDSGVAGSGRAGSGRADSERARGDRSGRSEPGSPVSSDDVLEMHLLLREWRGGLRELVDPTRSVP